MDHREANDEKVIEKLSEGVSCLEKAINIFSKVELSDFELQSYLSEIISRLEFCAGEISSLVESLREIQGEAQKEEKQPKETTRKKL